MANALKDALARFQQGPWGALPHAMRLLFITTPGRTGGWLAEAFAADRAVRIELEQATGAAAGLVRLQEETFDGLLVSHHLPDLDALELVAGLRAGGFEYPAVILGEESEQELAVLAYEVGADAYVCVHTATTRGLIWSLARAVDWHRLVRENRQLAQAQRQRLQWEHQEAERLLAHQRALVAELEAMQAGGSSAGPAQAGGTGWPVPSDAEAGGAAAVSPSQHLLREAAVPRASLPSRLVSQYRELLRAYVVMGSGHMGSEMAGIGEILVRAGLSAGQLVALHLEAVEDLLRGLGSRSARHVLNRADLLVLEVLLFLCEAYRRRYRQMQHPPRQLCLPGLGGWTPAAGERVG
jgi:DNA-binding NarL/FixJ family response regulator